MLNEVIIGIDLGGTHLRIGTVADNNRIVSQDMIDSSIIAGADHPIEKLYEIIFHYIRSNKIRNCKAISIGVPSSVATDGETVICTTNLRNQNNQAVFEHTNIAGYLHKKFQVPVYVNNDTSNILLYDVYANSLENQAVVLGVYIGTGVGASVLIHGKILKGANGAAMDVGHIPYYRGEDPCSCGKKGCCECYASGWRLQQIREQHYRDTDIRELFTKYQEGVPLKEFIDSCAHIYATLATIFNPESIIVGGGVMEMQDFPRGKFERQVKIHTGHDVMSYGFQFVYSEDLVGKGVVGAAIYAKQEMKFSKQRLLKKYQKNIDK